MKVLVFISFLFIACHVDARSIDGNSRKLDTDEEACISELHVNRDNIVAIDVKKQLPEVNDEFTKFMGCTGKRKGLISPIGEVVYEEIVKVIQKAAENDPEFPARKMSVFKQATINIVEDCHQNLTSDVNPGLVLIKTMNCIFSTRSLDGNSRILDTDEETCVSELHLNRDKIVGLDLKKQLPEDNGEFTQFMGCTGKRLGQISQTGEVIYDVILKGIWEAAENNPDFPVSKLSLLKQATTSVAEYCRQNLTSDVVPGLALIKAMNCMDTNVENYL